MDLKAFLNSLPDEEARQAFAVSCETTLGHMRNCIYTPKQLNPATCVLVWRRSGGKVTRQELRDDWREIWPELIGVTIDPADVAPVSGESATRAAHPAASSDADRRNAEQARMLKRALITRDGPSRERGGRRG